MGRHLAHSHYDIEKIVYKALEAKGGVIPYATCYPQQLFNRLEIAWGYRHDVFCALKRLEANGNIAKSVVVKRAAIPGRVRIPASREATYVAIKPPVTPVNRSAPVFHDAATRYA